MKKIIILMMVLVVSVFAEEVGIPYVEKGAGEVQSAVLTPNGKSFYTLKGKLVTQWQLNPIKKLDSFTVMLNENINTSQKYLIMGIFPDSKRMVLRSKSMLLLWSLENNTLIRKIKEKVSSGATDGSTLKTIHYYKNFNDKHLIDRGTIYKEWDESLSEINSRILPKLCPSENYTCYPNYMYITENRIFLFTQNSSHSASIMSVLNKRTLKIIKNFGFLGKFYMSSNKKNIFLPQEYPIISYEKVDMSTLEKVKVSSEKFNKTNNIKSRRSYISLVGKLSLVQEAEHFTRNGLDKYNILLNFYNVEKNKKIATFYQFENEEWILINSNGYFENSKNTKQYLKEKTSDGKIVPINDITYKKYSKKIRLKG